MSQPPQGRSRSAAGDLAQSARDWRRVFEVNLVGSFVFAKAVGPHFKKQKRGKVVNVASVLGVIGVAGATAYCAAKGRVIQLTRSLAVEWAPHGIQVNGIAPGLFDTDMSAGVFGNPEIYAAVMSGVPRGKHGVPGDLAGTVVFLSSRASDHQREGAAEPVMASLPIVYQGNLAIDRAELPWHRLLRSAPSQPARASLARRPRRRAACVPH